MMEKTDLVEIPVEQVQHGMFIAELDRPWLGTPFAMQGFLVANDRQIEALRQYCKTVFVDLTRSLEPFYRPAVVRAAGRHELLADGIAAASAGALEVGSVLSQVAKMRTARIPGRPPPAVSAVTGRSSLAEEILYSAPVIDDIKDRLRLTQAALAVDKPADLSPLFTLVAEMAEGVKRNPDALLWLTRLRSIDEYSYDHAIDVSVHLMVLASFLDLPHGRVEMLGRLGLMLDIGKVRLPESLLCKTEPLTAEELTVIRSHVASSLAILTKSGGFSHRDLAILGKHHERYDGSGYPRRLKGERLGLEAELCGLVDTYCALRRRRPYRDALSVQEALEKLHEMADKQFRRVVVDQLAQCLGLYPVGSLVELDSGEVAIVIQQNALRRRQPCVLVVLDSDKKLLKKSRTIDLAATGDAANSQVPSIVRTLAANAYGIHPDDFFLN